jgi:hypothetical protein
MEHPEPTDEHDKVWRPPHGRKTLWITRLILLLMAFGFIAMILITIASLF